MTWKNHEKMNTSKTLLQNRKQKYWLPKIKTSNFKQIKFACHSSCVTLTASNATPASQWLIKSTWVVAVPYVTRRKVGNHHGDSVITAVNTVKCNAWLMLVCRMRLPKYVPNQDTSAPTFEVKTLLLPVAYNTFGSARVYTAFWYNHMYIFGRYVQEKGARLS